MLQSVIFARFGLAAVACALGDADEADAHVEGAAAVSPVNTHGWDAGVLFEETSGTLLCGDLFTHTGNSPALTESDIVGPSIATEDFFQYTCLTPSTAPAIRKLADLAPRKLAVMHGSSFAGDAATALRSLAGEYDRRLRRALGETRPGKLAVVA